MYAYALYKNGAQGDQIRNLFNSVDTIKETKCDKKYRLLLTKEVWC